MVMGERPLRASVADSPRREAALGRSLLLSTLSSLLQLASLTGIIVPLFFTLPSFSTSDGRTLLASWNVDNLRLIQLILPPFAPSLVSSVASLATAWVGHPRTRERPCWLQSLPSWGPSGSSGSRSSRQMPSLPSRGRRPRRSPRGRSSSARTRNHLLRNAHAETSTPSCAEPRASSRSTQDAQRRLKCRPPAPPSGEGTCNSACSSCSPRPWWSWRAAPRRRRTPANLTRARAQIHSVSS